MSGKSETVVERENRDLLVKLLRVAISKSGFSLPELARKAGTDRTHLYRVLKGQKGLSKKLAITLADLLAIPEEDLVTAAGFGFEKDAGRRLTRMSLLEVFRCLEVLEECGISCQHFELLRNDRMVARAVSDVLLSIGRAKNLN